MLSNQKFSSQKLIQRGPDFQKSLEVIRPRPLLSADFSSTHQKDMELD